MQSSSAGAVVCNAGYRWIDGMKLKSDILKIVKKMVCYIAILGQKHTLFVAMRDIAGENKSLEVVDFPESMRVKTQELLPYFT